MGDATSVPQDAQRISEMGACSKTRRVPVGRQAAQALGVIDADALEDLRASRQPDALPERVRSRRLAHQRPWAQAREPVADERLLDEKGEGPWVDFLKGLGAWDDRKWTSRIAIEKSLAEIGHWPWGRNRLAELVDTLFEHHKVGLVGFDVVFAETDESSGLKQLRQLAQGDLRDEPKFIEQVGRMAPILDYDAASPAGVWTGTAYDGITGKVQAGRNGGAWNGSGMPKKGT